jgi:hypothetical protein
MPLPINVNTRPLKSEILRFAQNDNWAGPFKERQRRKTIPSCHSEPSGEESLPFNRLLIRFFTEFILERSEGFRMTSNVNRVLRHRFPLRQDSLTGFL